MLLARLAALAAAGMGLSCKAIDGWLAYEEIGSAMRTPRETPPARMDVLGRVPVVHVYGTPRQMGAQYGTLLRRPLRALSRCLHAFLSDESRARMLGYARRNEKHLPPDVREQLKAIAAAAGLPYDEVVALNVVPKLSCSALAVWGRARGPGGELIMGRNADYFSLGFTDRGMLVVVQHPADGLAVASVNFLGMVGAFTGINARGVAFGNMLVFNAAGPEEQDRGLSIQLAQHLAARRAATAPEMARILRSQQHVIPMNVMVADAGQAIVVELGLKGTALRKGATGILVASNYFHSPALHSAPERCPRYESLLDAARRHRGRLGVKEMKAALHTARIDGMNLQAVVFEPAEMRMHLSINRVPASAGPYVTLDLRKLFTPKELARLPAAAGKR